MNNEKRTAFGMLDDTDNALLELGDTVSLLAAAMKDTVGGRKLEHMLLHIASSIQDIRALLDEATAAVMQERKSGPAA